MPTADEPLLDRVLDEIYGAVHQPDRWAAVLEAYAQLVGGELGALYAPPLAGRTGNFFATYRLDVSPVLQHLATHGRTAPFGERAIALGLVPGVFTYDDVYPSKELHRTAYYQEYMRPMQVEHGLTVIVRLNGGDPAAAVSLTMGRSARQKRFGERERAMALAVFPHLRRAAGLVLDLSPARALDPALREALDGFSTPCCLLGAGGRLIHANSIARPMLEPTGVLRLNTGVVEAREGGARRRLAAALEAACDSGLNWRSRVPSNTPLPSPDGPPLLGVVVPLGHDNPFMNIGPVRAALYLLGSEAPALGEAGQRRLAGLFGLTGAETEITEAILKGQSVTDIADKRGVAVETVRGQVKAVLAKTQTRRQSDLTRLSTLFSTIPHFDDAG